MRQRDVWSWWEAYGGGSDSGCSSHWLNCKSAFTQQGTQLLQLWGLQRRQEPRFWSFWSEFYCRIVVIKSLILRKWFVLQTCCCLNPSKQNQIPEQLNCSSNPTQWTRTESRSSSELRSAAAWQTCFLTIEEPSRTKWSSWHFRSSGSAGSDCQQKLSWTRFWIYNPYLMMWTQSWVFWWNLLFCPTWFCFGSLVWQSKLR